MPTNELMKKYRESVCSQCKNNCNNKNVCDIRITTAWKEAEAKCVNYERED